MSLLTFSILLWLNTRLRGRLDQPLFASDVELLIMLLLLLLFLFFLCVVRLPSFWCRSSSSVFCVSWLSPFMKWKKKDGELFVGTVADFSGMDPLIYREPLRTEQYDATNLNGMSNSIPFSLVYDDVHILIKNFASFFFIYWQRPTLWALLRMATTSTLHFAKLPSSTWTAAKLCIRASLASANRIAVDRTSSNIVGLLFSNRDSTAPSRAIIPSTLMKSVRYYTVTTFSIHYLNLDF